MLGRYVRKLGIELEGGICKYHFNEIVKHFPNRRIELKGDGSVDVETNCDTLWRHDNNTWYYGGEIVTDPFRDWSELEEFISFVFEKTCFTQNYTCGNHMHLSFREPNWYYIGIMSKTRSVKKFLEAYKKHFRGLKYLERLDNGYCVAKYSLKDLEEMKIHGKRYYAVNFDAWFRHKTLEFRIFPHTNNAQEYMEMAKFLVSTVEKIIDEEEKIDRGLKLEISLPTSDDEVEIIYI